MCQSVFFAGVAFEKIPLLSFRSEAKESAFRSLGLAWGFSPTNRANKMRVALARVFPSELQNIYFSKLLKYIPRPCLSR
jgi:hypothetical protein